MNGFVHQQGNGLADGGGRPLLLKGAGLGGWLLPEGYMWRLPETCDSHRRMEKLVAGLLGKKEAEEFWQQYYAQYITEEDIRYIKTCGLNSVRLPMNARHLMQGYGEKRRINEAGFAHIDRLVSWCMLHGIYVVLDMHAAPGGQTGTNIDDSANQRPMLFEDPRHAEDTVWLWRQLAMRYADNPCIAGYDLLNEPLPNWFSQYNDRVLPLYLRIAEAIRSIDPNHLLILEGVHWATDFSIFAPLVKNRIDNCMLSFHKYWNNPDTESLRAYLDTREQGNYPVYMGEGGENNLSWYTGVFHLLSQHNIGWNFWSYKKMETHNSLVSVQMPARWGELAAYAAGGPRPDHAEKILAEYIHNICFENCTLLKDAARHVIRKAPLRIPAVYYDITPRGNAGKQETSIPFRTGDASTIRFLCTGEGEVNFKHYAGEDDADSQRLCLAVTAGESFTYTFEADGEPVALYCRSKTGGCLSAHINGSEACICVASPDMQIAVAGNAASGTNRLILTGVEGEVEVEWIRIG